jgi:hypothetical protein
VAVVEGVVVVEAKEVANVLVAVIVGASAKAVVGKGGSGNGGVCG